MSDKLNIEQLVKSTLGEAEITPSPGAWKSIQRKLRWKQFLRFHPGRFNIYYLAGLVVAGAVVAVVLSGRSAGTNMPPEIPVEIQPGAGQPEMRQDQMQTRPLEPSTEKERGTDPSGSATTARIQTSASNASGQNTSTISENQRMVEEAGNPVDSTDLIRNAEVNPGVFVPALPAIKNPSQKLVANFTTSVHSGCAPLQVEFFNQSIHATSYLWSFGNGAQSTLEDPEYLFEEPGKYTVTLRATDHEGSSLIELHTIEVYPDPKAEFVIEEGFEGVEGHVSLTLLNYSVGATTYLWRLLKEDLSVCNHWDSEDFQPSVKLADIKNGAECIRLVATSEFGCMDSAASPLPVKVESKEVKLKFATAFSPNPTGPGDGTFSPHEKRTDLFHPIFYEVPVGYHIRVYTKRGEMVFETRDIYQGWDGYFHQERSPGGVYVWMAEGTWANGEAFSMKGDVTLIWQELW